MEEDKPQIKIGIEGFDPLGLKAAGEISKEIVHLGIEGIKHFLNLTCKPLLEEIGFGLRDKWASWRLMNVISMLEKAQGKLRYDAEKEKLVIAPRVAFQIVECASITENKTLQEMWAGLFAASCNTYEEDENIMFVDILNRLTSSQVKLLTYLCIHSKKNINIRSLETVKEQGTIFPGIVQVKYDELFSIMETKNSLKVDNELIGLESMGLLLFDGNVNAGMTIGQKIKIHGYRGLKPTSLSIMLYIRCQGSNNTPFDYFLQSITDDYFNMVKDYLVVEKSNVLETVFAMSKRGEMLDGDIKYQSPGNGPTRFEIAKLEWRSLSEEEFNSKLRDYMIFRCLGFLDKTSPVKIGEHLVGNFGFKQGVTWNE